MNKDDNAIEKVELQTPNLIPIKKRGPLSSINLKTSFDNSQNTESVKSLHLRDYLSVLLRRKWIFITFFVSVVGLVTLVSFLMSPVYKATTTIQIKNENPDIINFSNKQGEKPSEDYYPTQYNIITSRNLAQRVITKLNLGENPHLFDKGLFSSMISSIINIIPLSEKEVAEEDGNTSLVNNFLENLDVQPIESSQLVNISFLSSSPLLAANVAGTIADEYINFTMESKLQPTLEAKERLKEEVDTIRTKLKVSEEKLNEYIARSQIIFLTAKDKEYESLLTHKVSELSDELDRAIADRISKEAIFREVMKNGVEYGAVLQNPLIQSLTLEYAKLESEYFNLLKVYKPEYPNMLRLEKQIENIKNKISSEEQRILNTLESDYNIAVKKEAYLSSAIESLRQDVSAFQQKMVHYQILKNEVETNRNLYNTLFQRLKEVDVNTALTESNVQVIDKPEVPQKPFKPNKPLNLAVSIFIGLIGGIFLVFFVEYLDHSVKHVDDVEREARIPVLGTVPMLKMDQNKLITDGSNNNAPFVEALKSISTFIQFTNTSKPPKQILVTSPLPRDGKTLLATNISKNFITFVGKGIVIDADMRRPSIHKFLNLKNTVGLSSYLSGAADLNSVINKAPHPRFDTITSGPVPANPSALLNSVRMKELIDSLSSMYDYVVIDSPPVLGISDGMILSQFAEAVLVVVRASNTPKDALAQSIKLLKGVNANILGVVLNGINLNKRNGYAHYYSAYYNANK